VPAGLGAVVAKQEPCQRNYPVEAIVRNILFYYNI